MSDLRFLPQALILHQSLLTHGSGFQLTVLCMDEPSHSVLSRRALPGVELIKLAELERADPALAESREGRSWREYCWTAIPAVCHHRLEQAPEGAVLLWVDADIEFSRDPKGLIDQLGDGSLLLTPHRYNRLYPISAPGSWLAENYGTFNGGSIAFRRDEPGRRALALWRERTLAWCYDARAPGRYGNQRHLDDFPDRFPGAARVLTVPGGIIGPWNGGGFRIRREQDGATADGLPIFAYHFQSLRVTRASPRLFHGPASNTLDLPNARPRQQARVEPHYGISASERRVFWRPYVHRLDRAIVEVIRDEPRYEQVIAPAPSSAKALGTMCWRLALESSRVWAPVIRLAAGVGRRLVCPRP